jgi:[acyl-carrier-protein] S-malonyltransferase
MRGPVAILCSGQGYQDAGMFDLLADAPAATPVFEAAKLVLDGKDPRQLVREASSDDLHADKIGQILCCTQAMAAWAVLSAKTPRPLVVAGYSVGELAAWGVAGLLDHEGSWISRSSLRRRWIKQRTSRLDSPRSAVSAGRLGSNL